MMKTKVFYIGKKDGTIERSSKVPMSIPVEAHRVSPTGLGWGYGGSGAYATAYTLLYDAVSKKAADKWAMDFKWDVIAELRFGEPFELSLASVRQWVKQKESQV